MLDAVVKGVIIVAEMGASHHRNLRRACAIVEAAAEAGATAIKLQTFTPDTMVADKDYIIPSGPWAGQNLHQLYQEAALPLEWHPTLFQVADDCGIECFSSPFSEEAVEFLERLNCPRYKIASFEITDIPLIRAVAEIRKPVIISTGMATLEEIAEAVRTIKEIHTDITLLKCTSAYPSTAKDANLQTMVNMSRRFQCPVGVSDHTMGRSVPIAAAVMGAQMIEKHITLDDEHGPDSHFALRPAEFGDMVRSVHDALEAKGEVRYGPTFAEAPSLHLRRSVYALRDINRGDVLDKSRIGLRRPNNGLPANKLESTIGRTASKDIPQGNPITQDCLQ